MKGKSVEAATKAALEVLKGEEKDARVVVLTEGKPGMLGMLGGEEAEVEVTLKEGVEADANQLLQDILDRMKFMAVSDAKKTEGGVELSIKGEDMGRIIGKEGATLKSLEMIISAALRRLYAERVRVSIDADGYKDKRKKALERLARDVAEEVAKSGKEKTLPPMNAADRRIIHLCLQEHKEVATESKGEGRERRLVVSPAK
jgi:spoIIIJ-associated protein